jgi:hypothetical protein
MQDPVRDPGASVWQSTLETVASRRSIGARFNQAALTAPCADLAYRLAATKVFGPAADVVRLQAEFDFGTCDPFWAECIAEYVEHYRIAPAAIPYRAGIDNVLDPVPAKCRIALFGDWGTGEQPAMNVLMDIDDHEPELLIHLGDIYYSGKKEECQTRFLDEVKRYQPSPRCLSLCGNHDVYSGGEGYYWLVDQLGQRASYFAIENESWIIIGADTGKNDYALPARETYLEASELTWIREKIANAGNKKVILLTHHPLFSAYEPTPFDDVNDKLLTQVAGFLPNVTAWIWAHEHRFAAYGPYLGLQRGRCLGHGAVPVLAAGSDTVRFPEVPVIDVPQPPPVDGYNRNGYAILDLDGTVGTVSYYCQGISEPIWTETF